MKLGRMMLKVISVVFIFSMFQANVFAATDIYTVQPGDSLWVIAQKYKVGVDEIIKANPRLKDPSMIFPGDKITINMVDAAVLGTEEQVLKLCNEQRAKNGLKPLTLNWEVSRVARAKSQDMKDKNYFNHQSPTYGSPFDMLKNFGIPYKAAGENIAKGQKTPEAVVTAWMNSEGHRKNILSPTFTQLGVGYVSGSTTYWTQLFLKP